MPRPVGRFPDIYGRIRRGPAYVATPPQAAKPVPTEQYPLSMIHLNRQYYGNVMCGFAKESSRDQGRVATLRRTPESRQARYEGIAKIDGGQGCIVEWVWV